MIAKIIFALIATILGSGCVTLAQRDKAVAAERQRLMPIINACGDLAQKVIAIGSQIGKANERIVEHGSQVTSCRHARCA